MTTTEALDFILSEIKGLEQTDTGKFMVDPSSAEAIKAILLIEKEVDSVKDIFKARLEAEALSRDPNFKGIEGLGVRASYRATGAAYSIADQAVVPVELLKTTIDSSALNMWLKSHFEQELPPGIAPVEGRAMSLSFSLVKDRAAND